MALAQREDAAYEGDDGFELSGIDERSVVAVFCAATPTGSVLGDEEARVWLAPGDAGVRVCG